MLIPEYLIKATEEECGGYKPNELRERARELSKRYLAGSAEGGRVVNDDALAAAYAAVRMPATYGAVRAAASLMRKNYEGEFEDMLDAGAGTGTAYLAVREALGVSRATLVEREEAMLKLARKFCKAGGAEAEFVSADLASFTPDRKYDLVTASYVFNEMSEPERNAALDKLFAATGKVLLIVEPGTPYHFELQCKIRSYLRAKGAKLFSPCPEGAVCGIEEGDWCHFSVRVPRGKLHKFLKGGDAPYEDEKFTYSAFRFDGADNACSARVLRHPVISKGRADLTLCTKEGVVEVAVRKQDGAPWKTARKLEAGDKFEMPEDTL